MRRPSRTPWLFVFPPVVVFAIVAGCGARTGLPVGVEEGADTWTDASVPRDAPPDRLADTVADRVESGDAPLPRCISSQPGWSPNCSDTPPAIGSPCPYVYEGIQCEYGDDDNIACNTIIMCTSHAWRLKPVLDPDLCGKGQCPATYGDITGGAPCSPAALLCSYPDGACACDKTSGQWVCAARDPKCPFPRPHLGCPSIAGLIPDSDVKPALECSMLPCNYELEDESAIWQTRSTGDPTCNKP